jgi:hypothetical protein
MNRLFYTILFFALFQLHAFGQNDWSTFLGKKSYVTINYLPDYNYIPDGHLSVLPDSDGQYKMYWSEYRNSRTTGNTQFPESQRTLQPDTSIFGGRMGNEGPSNGVNDGGSWLMSVHRHSGDTLVGFYHGESHWYPRNGNYTAWKSLCVAYSYDNGFSWVDSGQIITSHKPKPETREWGGAGDCCVVWDSVNSRWNCYFQEHNIRMAVSYDPMGAPGTWIKYHDGSFDEAGLGGYSTPLNNLAQTGGANPSVHWNTFYKKWVMTFHGWDGGIYLTLSQDGITWDYPSKIVSKGEYNNWYPTIIGETDTKAGKLARLYYGEFYTSSGWRFLVGHDILFDSTSYDYGYVNAPWQVANLGGFNFAGKAGIRNDVLTITGTTNSESPEDDKLFYMHRHVVSQGEISARLSYQTDYNNKANSGLMMRSAVTAGSQYVSLSKKSVTDTVQVIYRTETNGPTVMESFETDANWLKINYSHSEAAIMVSQDGNDWVVLKSLAIDLPPDAYAGFYNTSHDETNFCTAKFDNIIFDFGDVGIDEEKYELIKVFPNPANDVLKISLDSNANYQQLHFKIFGIDGKMHKTGMVKPGKSTIDINELPKRQQFIMQLFEGSVLVFEDKFMRL